tara:strand:- start:950 stop:1474 length:525 start_codon:yes stop_codon:yes gene_type:complete
MEIPGFNNYLLFRNGSILSKGNPTCPYHNHRRPCFLSKKMNSGYLFYGLINNDKKMINKTVHRLLAEHYIPNPDNKPTVDHINRIKDDNRLCNLRWATYKEQRDNQNIYRLRKDNPSGHKNIGKRSDYDGWYFNKRIKGKKYNKSFTNKTDAICYKYIFLLRMKAGHFKRSKLC